MRLFVCICLLLVSVDILAVPAYPRAVKIQTPDGGEVYITLHGDETKKWATSIDNYTLLPTEKGWVYAQEGADGYAIPSSFLLFAKERIKDSSFLQFKQSLKKNLPIKIPLLENTYETRATTTLKKGNVIGNRKALVILMEFADLSFKKTLDDFYRLFNEKGYIEDGAKGSVHDYYHWASHGRMNLLCDVIGPFKSEHPMAYYGKNTAVSNDLNPYALFEESINKAAEQVDLTQYDANNDGYIDNVHIIFAGHGEESGASSSAIWSHEMNFTPIVVQNLLVDRYSCAAELRGNNGDGISRIGPHCHEMGHALGAMDYYDTDYETGGAYIGTGKWDIMAQGSWNEDGISPANFNPYVRIYDFGWEEPRTLPTGDYTVITPSNKQAGHIYKINTPIENEFFLIENRSLTSFDSSLPNQGLHIYHIGSGLAEKATMNKINASYPQECYLVCASSDYDLPTNVPASYGKINEAGATFPGSENNTRFDSESIPSSRCQNGYDSKISLSEITMLSDGSISLYNNIQPEMTVFWEEDFEEDTALSKWSIDGGSAQEMKLYSFSDSNDSDFEIPNVGNETKCIYIQNTKSFNCNASITSQWIACDESNFCKLSFQYGIMSKKITPNTLLSIRIRTGKESEWMLLDSFQEVTDNWISVECLLPQCIDSIQLSFDYSVGLLSLICLDNIKIGFNPKVANLLKECNTEEQVSPIKITQYDNILWVSSQNASRTFFVYNLQGHLLMTKELPLQVPVCINFPAGVYILSSDQFKKKVIIR